MRKGYNYSQKGELVKFEQLRREITNLKTSISSLNDRIQLSDQTPIPLSDQTVATTAVSTLTYPSSAIKSGAWNAIAFSESLGRLVAVCGSGVVTTRVMTSPNGEIWNLRNTPSDSSWCSVAWSPSLQLFCAVATSGNCMTSPDGFTWTARTVPSRQYKSICWSTKRGRFVAVSNNGGISRVITSTDGINWVTINVASPLSLQEWNSVTYSEDTEMFIAVAGGAPTTLNYNRLMKSTNGESWSPISVPATDPFDSSFTTVQYCGPVIGWLAGASRGNTRLVRSLDSTDWGGVTLPFIFSFRSIAYSKELGVAMAVSESGGSAGAARVAFTFNGTTWTNLIVAGYSGVSLEAIQWAAPLGVFVITGTSGTNSAVEFRVAKTTLPSSTVFRIYRY